MTLEQQVRVWVEQAEYDLRSAASSAANGFDAQCAVSCEQSAEKLLKALWIYRNKQGPPRDHRIADLAASLGAPSNAVTAAGLLEPDYIAARYPDAALVTPYMRYDATASQDRLQAAKQIATWVRQKLAEEGWA